MRSEADDRDPERSPSDLGPSFDTEELRAALRVVNVPVLMLAMAQLTGSDRWLTGEYAPVGTMGPDENDDGGLAPEVRARMVDDVVGVVGAHRRDPLPESPTLEGSEVLRRLGRGMGLREHIPAGSAGLFAEELGTADRFDIPGLAGALDGLPGVVVVGAGLGGLCVAAQLKRAGVPFRVFERGGRPGGTWQENRYPGCGVDTPSHLYSFSFGQSPSWSRYFSKQSELAAYVDRLVADHELAPHIECGVTVESAEWMESAQQWSLVVTDRHGDRKGVRATFVVCGTGLFSRPSAPALPGLSDFGGSVLHTARWRDVELDGKRVVVIGTGASAMQLVPSIVDRTAHLSVVQRTPQWAIPNPNYHRTVPHGVRSAMRHVPHYQSWYRLTQLWTYGDRLYPALQRDPAWQHDPLAISELNDRHRRHLTEHLHSELGDQAGRLIDSCLPRYPPYAKRPLLDNGWFRTMARDDVSLVTSPVTSVHRDGVWTADGEKLPAEVLILATGFSVLDLLGDLEVRGRDGRRLGDLWGVDDPRAHLGMTIPGFPNLFLIMGPNSFAGHGGSAQMTIELQVRYILSLIVGVREHGHLSAEIRSDVFAAYSDEMDAALERTIWAHPGATTYYRNSRGRIVVPMPWTNFEYWHRTREPDVGEYELRSRRR